jgi:hypothetical protein
MPGKSPAELGWGLARVRTSTHTIAACSPVWLPNRNEWAPEFDLVSGDRWSMREHRVVEPRQRCDTHTSEPMHRILRFYV